MTIYQESQGLLDHMFNACTTAQISEFIPEKRGFRLHGHSTTVTLERAFWNVLDAMAEDCSLPVPRLIEQVLDSCMVANDKNLSSCLRVICLKYLNIYAMGSPPSAPAECCAVPSAKKNGEPG
jgi:predicted DNA-binding ribbon-helix-helix protein